MHVVDYAGAAKTRCRHGQGVCCSTNDSWHDVYFECCSSGAWANSTGKHTEDCELIDMKEHLIIVAPDVTVRSPM